VIKAPNLAQMLATIIQNFSVIEPPQIYLGVLITRDLKFHKQCVQSAKKAQSVLGMVKRHFKLIDKDDFTVTAL